MNIHRHLEIFSTNCLHFGHNCYGVRSFRRQVMLGLKMSDGSVNSSLSNKLLSKQLKRKASDFLNSRKNANNLVDIIQSLEKSIGDQNASSPIIPSVLALETIFTELLRNRAMVIEVQPLKPKENSPEILYREWLQDRYTEAYQFILKCLCLDKVSDAIQALATAMNLLALEGQFPIDFVTEAAYYFPCSKLRSILQCLLSTDKANDHLVSRFQEFTAYHDVLQHSWKLLPGLTPRGQAPNDTYMSNYLDLINAMPIKSAEQEQINLLCDNSDKGKMTFDYQTIRRNINKSWACVMHWQHTEATHQKVLMVLLERVLPHLDKPLALTDFLMDSLDAGGAISLLAFQGVFTLIQEHNLTYPFIYEKLYSMFEPEIFHTKFKARLFYLADLFLSSTHLPEALVAAFVKRLARLTLVAPPQDIVICLYFIGNLIIRHPGLKRLICHPNGGQVTRDPFIMDECDPTKSNAIESSLWEIAALQSHGISSIATAAKFISNPLPTIEWDLTQVLGVTEDDLFDQAIKKSSKAAFLTFDRPTAMFLPKGDRMQEFWKLF